MTRITRRSGLLTGLLLAFGQRAKAATNPAPALFASPAAGHAIGAAYLRNYPFDGLADVRSVARLPRAQLTARVRGDFAAGRIVVLEGWMLSATEARLCALALRSA
jgi:hypothetical protein